ncbi:Coiled-coil domain-containing protein [Schistosoma japonicum]|nr:Coiled-coil domain-containing protein [Schistosoma japonicum]
MIKFEISTVSLIILAYSDAGKYNAYYPTTLYVFLFKGSIPLLQLNYSELSAQVLIPREQIEGCIENVCVTLGQYLYLEKFAEIIFNDIGKLRIHKGKSKFCFFSSFLNELDNTGRLAQSFQNRPPSSDCVTTDRSVMSNKSHRSTNSIEKLTVIDEHEPSKSPVTALIQSKRQDDKSDISSTFSRMDYLDTTKSNPDSSASCINTGQMQNNQVSTFQEVPELVNRPRSLPEKNTTEDFIGSSLFSCISSENETNRKGFISPNLPKLCTANLSQHFMKSSKHPSHCSVSCMSSNSSNYSRSSLSSVRSLKSNIEELEKRIPQRDENCNHALTKYNGLCYLCHQRRIRNIPVDLKDEIKKKEQAEEELLQIYQRMRANNEAKQEQETLLNKRIELCKQAAFNLGVACSKRMKKSFVDPTCYQSFIMNKRPPTPLRQIKQNELKTELDNQIQQRLTDIHHIKEQELFSNKLEQVKLTEELENQRKRAYESKLQNQTEYKEALDFQVKHKPEHLPKSEDNSLGSMSRLFDDNDEKLIKRNLIAKSIQQHQLKSIKELKNQLENEKLCENEQEKKLLKRVHDDLIADKLQRKQEQKAIRQYLQNEWLTATQVKQDKELHEKLRDQAQQSLTLLDQTRNYKRCNQCKRGLDNVGQFHITTDTYVPGKHFVI